MAGATRRNRGRRSMAEVGGDRDDFLARLTVAQALADAVPPRVLRDGRAIRLTVRLYNTLVTVSDTVEDPCWRDGW